MNYGNSRQAHYLSRIPGRQQQQGLSSRILRSSPQASGGNYFFSREMSDCILGNYPSEKQAIENVISYRWNSVAFSRDLAVSCDTGRIFLHFKGRLIGMQDGDKYLLFNTRESAALKKTIGDKVCLL
jgi:hypothetical protein